MANRNQVKGTTWKQAIIAGIICNIIFWTPVIIALLIRFHLK